MTNLKNLGEEEIYQTIKQEGYKKYRADQILNWLYRQNANSFREMTNLSKEMREDFEEKFSLPRIKLLKRTEAEDKSVKLLYELPDGERIESVLIPERKRNTLCISVQVGCRMGCRFCATGKIGLIRNLQNWEIIEQVRETQEIMDKEIDNVVLMGMGEPLDNTNEVIKAIKKLNTLMQIGARRITLSTSGISEEIYKIAEVPIQFRLAISLNATDDELRSKIMPVNRKFNIEKVLEAGSHYAIKKNLRVTLEYIIFKGLNDSRKDAEKLAGLSARLPSKINLIPYNPTGIEGYERPSEEKVLDFKDILESRDLTVNVRWSKGRDKNAACGQLRGDYS